MILSRTTLGWVALAMAFALGACEEEAPVATVPEEWVAFDADGIVFQMQHRFTQDGRTQALVVADTAIQWNDSASIALRGVWLQVFQEDGQERGTVTSERGWLDPVTEELVAQGNAVLLVPGQNRRVESAELNFQPRNDVLWTDSAFVMQHDGQPFRGQWFRTDLEFRQVRIGGEPRPDGEEGS